jgi:NAD(P)-dependent dehydrogenase (short-subunit alcohol dehydrogenase family)
LVDSKRLAVVTGGGSGMGLATARLLVLDGYHVALIGRNVDALAQAATALSDEVSDSASWFAVDVTDRPGLTKVFADLHDKHGPVAALFSNAGVGKWSPLQELPLAEWRRVIDTNVGGTFNVCQLALDQMSTAGRGSVVIMSSDLAIIGRRNFSAYTASKAALYGLTKALALEFAPNIRVNAVGPGPIDTPHLRSGRTGAEWDAAEEVYRAGIPMRRLGTSEDVAPIVQFLLSDDASAITGQMIQPNGGQVMW